MGDLTPIQKEMLKCMLLWDEEYSYPYDHFEDEYGHLITDKKILKKEMRGLLASGRVELYRGGLNEDGEVVGGCGFSIPYDRRREIETEVL